MFYTIQNAKSDFLEGWLDGYSIYRENNGWSVEVYQGKDRDKRIRRKIFTARKELKVYKTLDSALQEVSKIGFQTEILEGVM